MRNGEFWWSRNMLGRSLNYSFNLEVTDCAKGEYTASFKSGKINEEDVSGRPVQVRKFKYYSYSITIV